MRLPTPTSNAELTRRAIIALPLLFATNQPLSALAASERVTAQSVGIDVGSPLFDPRDPFGAEKGIVWGGRDRCDPTDAACQQGGVLDTTTVQPKPATPPAFEVSDRVKFTVSIAGEAAGEIVLGLYRSAAPQSVDTFVQLARGTLATAPGDAPASYERSVAKRVSRDQEVVLGVLKKQGGQTMLISGQTRPKIVPVAAPLVDDANALSHDAAGLVSMRKGGGSFEFSISTRASPTLDKVAYTWSGWNSGLAVCLVRVHNAMICTVPALLLPALPLPACSDGLHSFEPSYGQQELLVIGQVLEGMELVERLNTLPTNNYNSGPMATVRMERISVL